MKRIVTLILVTVMLLSTVSCGAAVNAPVSEAENTAVVLTDELVSTAVNSDDSIAKAQAKDDVYIRGGDSANKNFYATKKDSGSMEFKKDTGNYRRDILVKFDISNMDLFGMQTVYLYLNFSSNGGGSSKGEDLYVYAYEIPYDWDPKTVTYNTAPTFEENDPDGKGYVPSSGTCQVDVSNAVFDALDEGRTQIAFRLVMSGTTNSQCYVTSVHNDNPHARPRLIARSTSSEYNYETKLVSDDAKNAALWDYAQQMYDEWYARYQEILAKGDYAYETVVTNPEEYNTTVMARKGNSGKDIIAQSTRLVSDLEGYTEYVYDVDVYGGATPKEKQEATGYYYTTQINGRWWLVDPTGNLVHIHGTTHFKYGYGTSETSYSKNQTATALARFGSLEKWAIAATRWAKNDLGVNATYAVAAVSRKVEEMIPNLYGISGMSSYANEIGALLPGSGIPSFVGGAMPVFNPGFVDYMDAKAKTAAANNAGKPYIIGYITDNEINVSDRMLASYLTLDHTVDVNVYSYVCAWTWYKNMTGESNPSVQDISNYSAQLGFDLFDVFKGFIYDRYFSVCKTAIEKYDPERLYFGQRFLIDCSKWEWMIRFAGYWCDVMSINYYHEWEIPASRATKNGRPTLDQIGAWLGKPFLVTEFYSKGDDAVDLNGNAFTNNDGAGWVVATQTERGYFYQNYTLKLLQCKNSIGWMQFQFIDNDPLVENGESSNKGIVDGNNDFTAYSDFTDQLAMLNKNTYALIEYFDGYQYFK